MFVALVVERDDLKPLLNDRAFMAKVIEAIEQVLRCRSCRSAQGGRRGISGKTYRVEERAVPPSHLSSHVLTTPPLPWEKVLVIAVSKSRTFIWKAYAVEIKAMGISATSS